MLMASAGVLEYVDGQCWSIGTCWWPVLEYWKNKIK
jgi:hypothetical protein